MSSPLPPRPRVTPLTAGPFADSPDRWRGTPPVLPSTCLPPAAVARRLARLGAAPPPATGLPTPVWRQLLGSGSMRAAVRRRLVERAFPVHRGVDPLSHSLRRGCAELHFACYLSKARWQRVEDRAREAQRAARDVVAAGSSRGRQSPRTVSPPPLSPRDCRAVLTGARGSAEEVQGWLLRWWALLQRHCAGSADAPGDAACVHRALYVRLHIAFHHPLLYAGAQGDWRLCCADLRGAERLAEADWRRDSNWTRAISRDQVCDALWRWAAAWVESAAAAEGCELLRCCYEWLASAAEPGQPLSVLPEVTAVDSAKQLRKPAVSPSYEDSEEGDLAEEEPDWEPDLGTLTPYERGLLGLAAEDDAGADPAWYSCWGRRTHDDPRPRPPEPDAGEGAPPGGLWAASCQSCQSVLSGAVRRLDSVDPDAHRDAMVRLPGGRLAPQQKFTAERVAMRRLEGRLRRGMRVPQGGTAVLRYLNSGVLPNYSLSVMQRRAPEVLSALRSALSDGAATEAIAGTLPPAGSPSPTRSAAPSSRMGPSPPPSARGSRAGGWRPSSAASSQPRHRRFPKDKVRVPRGGGGGWGAQRRPSHGLCHTHHIAGCPSPNPPRPATAGGSRLVVRPTPAELRR
eukprot:TRINITY_DN61008_c0_g1_i1.p1 TRINITY_DN61008_c0_g1~~TRINITY_DN61008_c0_g1_i1.p1  ORF type:complete len:651 (+),score=100.25 TRINITY_DN61008_c0_g1_i1:73-1953(+)